MLVNGPSRIAPVRKGGTHSETSSSLYISWIVVRSPYYFEEQARYTC